MSESRRPYLVFSADSHAGPSLERQLRQYCPKEYLEKFDEFAAELRQIQKGDVDPRTFEQQLQANDGRSIRLNHGLTSPADAEAWQLARTCAGQQDPHARLRDMDSDGVAADCIFSGGQNGEVLPFSSGFGFNAGPTEVAGELRAVGGHIWNLWLSDFVSVAPARHVGVMQIPIWDIDASVREVEWGREQGLKAVNLPAPRADYPVYNLPLYEPLWSACEALQLPLVTHSGGGENPLGSETEGGWLLSGAEHLFFARRALWQLISGGVFERHPGLKLVFTEQRAGWVPYTLNDLDSIYLSFYAPPLPRAPRDYWFSNCYLSGSFLARFEAEMRHDVGLKNLMWGTDYPHYEGTWPNTRLAMRHTLAGLPEEDVRLILGENALSVFDLDSAYLRVIADAIGPRPEEINQPVADADLPAHRGLAFRKVGSFG